VKSVLVFVLASVAVVSAQRPAFHTETELVLDVSGSMGGELATVREGLHECLSGLGADDEVREVNMTVRGRAYVVRARKAYVKP